MRLIVSRYSYLFVLISFFLLIIFGTILLSISNIIENNKIFFIDALFLSVSAVTGVGVSVIDISSLTALGKLILIFLMYAGSVGILTILLAIIFYFSFYNIEWYGLATEILDIISIQKIYSFFKIMFLTSLFMQFFGSISLIILAKYLNQPISLLDSIFISINFFCNVGFTVDKIISPVIFNHQTWYIISSILIITGSSGFLLLFEAKEYFKQKIQQKNYCFSVTSKLMIRMYFIPMLFFWLFYLYFCENKITFYTIMRSLFSAVSLRSCGVSPYKDLSSSIIFISAIYGIMGTGPLGTGGGIKTSILGIIIYTFLFFFNKKDTVIIFMKRISWELVAFAHIFLLYIILFISIISIIIDLYYNHNIDFILLYSDVIGLMTGSGTLWSQLVSSIDTIQKILCIMLMCIGKISTVSMSLYMSKIKKSELQYPNTKLIII